MFLLYSNALLLILQTSLLLLASHKRPVYDKVKSAILL
jgi:hypothetical protein